MNAPQAVPDSTTAASLTRGEVAAHDATAAHDSAGDGDRFVVGVDGSAQSIDALKWAARIAAGTSARIEVLTTWEPRLGTSGPFVATGDASYIGPEAEAHALLTHTVQAAYGGDRPPNLTLVARQGHAAHILVEESKTAQLLVIGSRGLGEMAGLLLGSVSAHCAEKAQCPVLIIHAPAPT